MMTMRPLALLFLLSSPTPLLAQAPDPAELSRRGSELMAAGRYAEAVPVYRDLAKAVPGNAGLLVNLGMALHLSGQDSEAVAPLEAALKLDPDSAPATLFLGAARMSLGRTAAAVAPLQRAVRLQPENREARSMLADALVTLDRHAEAEPHLRRLSRTYPRDPVVWFALGKTYEALAGQAFGRLLERDPESPLTLALVAEARLDEGQTAAAFQLYRRALERAPAQRGLHAGVAEVYRRTGHPDWAAVEEEQEKRLPKADCARDALECAFAGGKHREVLAAASKIETLTASYWLARSANALAVEAFTRLTALPPSAPSHEWTAAMQRNSPTPRKHLIETMPGGMAVFDFDGDGRLDLFFTNGAAVPGLVKDSPRYWSRLFRNEGGIKFTDRTEEAGLRGEGYGMSAAVADYDNDGDADLFVGGVHRQHLYRNTGGRFEDVTARARLASDQWVVGGGWFDYDNDGWLDLLVVNYTTWTAEYDRFCGDQARGIRVYCHPKWFPAIPLSLHRNRGDGTFEDVSVKSGIAAHRGRGMGLAFADFDRDGFSDFYVTNDKLPSFLFRNRGDGTFEETALLAGVTLPEHGQDISAMAVDFGRLRQRRPARRPRHGARRRELPALPQPGEGSVPGRDLPQRARAPGGRAERLEQWPPRLRQRRLEGPLHRQLPVRVVEQVADVHPELGTDHRESPEEAQVHVPHARALELVPLAVAEPRHVSAGRLGERGLVVVGLGVGARLAGRARVAADVDQDGAAAGAVERVVGAADRVARARVGGEDAVELPVLDDLGEDVLRLLREGQLVDEAHLEDVRPVESHRYEKFLSSTAG